MARHALPPAGLLARMLAAALLCSTGSWAAADGAVTPAEPAEEPVYVAPTRADRVGRIMAPVMVNGRGPYAFIVDTGASRSTMAPRLARALGLEPDPTQLVSLRGITGAERVPSIMVDSLQAGDISIERQRLPVVSRDIFADADGILGVEGFARMCLHASFSRGHITILKNGCPVMHDPWLRVAGTLRPDRLLIIRARIGRVPVRTVIDTGAERSLGNLALLRALQMESRAENPASETTVFGATSQLASGNLLAAPTVYLGEIGINNVRITFGDFDVFSLWKIAAEPALVLGMDVLGTVDALMVDYRRAEFRILPSNPGGALIIRGVKSPSRIR